MSRKPKIPFVVGPTAVGKSALSIELARKIPVEIISADSRQIFRYMDIGTAKVSRIIRQAIPHHFVDIIDPDGYFSAGMFSEQARQVIKKILSRNKIPLVVGGSGLYIRALIHGFFSGDIKDRQIRIRLEEELASKGLEVLYERLERCDPEYARKISSRDTQRILRSLEVYQVSGIPFSEWHKKGNQEAFFEAVQIGLRMPREVLYERINQRVDRMFEQGFIEEVKALLQKGYSSDLNALNTVGYKEICACLRGEISLEEAKSLIKRNSRRYAKRQMTWFGRDRTIRWYEIQNKQDLAGIANKWLADFKTF